jgi:hypothetical protein
MLAWAESEQNNELSQQANNENSAWSSMLSGISKLPVYLQTTLDSMWE